MTVSLLTNGWVCYGNRTIINKYVLPYNLQIKNKTAINLRIKENQKFNLSLSNIVDKNINLKIDESQINIINNSDDQINLKN